MAELPKNIRKPGGDLVPARSPFTRRVLLPTEADLCNLLGITEEEYFQFLEGVAAKVKERPEAYDLIPDIRCDPVSLGLVTKAGALTVFGQIVVGVALTVLAYLLTPKPDLRKGTNERTADMAGLKRFAPQFSFNTVQELANLGDLVPLVFTDRQEIAGEKYGGVRVDSQLMWSQLISLGRYQQLKLFGLFSLGEIEKRPDFEGYAIGDLLISNYHAKKIFKLDYPEIPPDGSPPDGPPGGNIPFLRAGGKLSNIIKQFQIDDKNYFSGTRNPTTQATFGLSTPAPNMTYYRLPYELVRTPSNTDTDEGRPAGRVTFKKRRKLLGAWPFRCGFIAGGNSNQKSGDEKLSKGTIIKYELLGSGDLDGNLYDGIGYQQDAKDTIPDTKDNRQLRENLTMQPHGVEDINAATKTVRETTDGVIVENEQYMVGTALVNCTKIYEGVSNKSGLPWSGTFTRYYEFEVLEEGYYHASPSGALANHCTNPNWDQNGRFFTVKPRALHRDDHFWYDQIYNELYEPHERYTLQKTTLGTISNNRNCDITEIGIKSKVYKRMAFANVNSKPEEDRILDVYDDKSTLTLGRVDKYIARYSFFKLQLKVEDKSDPDKFQWVDLSPTDVLNHSGLFCVRGNSPEFQYNYLRIDHPKGQYEYRFLPWPGNDVIKQVIAMEKKSYAPIYVCLLNANNATKTGSLQQFRSGPSDNFTVKFAGQKTYPLSKSKLSNSEWNLGHPSRQYLGLTGNIVQGFDINHKGNYPDASSSNLPQTYQTAWRWTKVSLPSPYGTVNYNKAGNQISTGGFEGPTHGTVIVRFDNWPKQGQYTWSLYINARDVTPNLEGYNGPEWPQAIRRTTSSPIGVAFHYTKNDGTGMGGKFVPGPQVFTGSPHYQTNWYSVKKEEQIGTVLPPVIDKEVTLVNKQVSEGYSIVGGGSAQGLKVNLKVWTNLPEKTRWYAEWSLSNVGMNYADGNIVTIPAQDYGGSALTEDIDLELEVESGERVYEDEDIEHKLNPYDAAADFWKYEGDQSSHLEGPEHQITYVNEIVKTEDESTEPGVGPEATYEDLAYAGLQIDSSKEWTNFSQFSAYFKKGIKVTDLVDSPDWDSTVTYSTNDIVFYKGKSYKARPDSNNNSQSFTNKIPGNEPLYWEIYGEASSLFPEIVYALLTDKKIGAGAVINTDSVNKYNMGIAAKFCRANKFFWDGVVSNKVNLRQFIFEQGAQCLLDFTIIGGQFSLYPAVPFDENTYEMKNDKEVVIKGMFTDGNIKDLNVAFLLPEDRQTFKANVIYREEVENKFPENKSKVVRLADEKDADGNVLVSHVDDPLETFDLSGFCTSEKHAEQFGRYVLAVRKFVDHTITFKTAPHYINGIQPGDYIRVYSTTQHVQRFNNGAILDDGTIVSKDTISGSKTFYWWNAKESVVNEDTEDFSNPLPAKYRNSLFTIKETDASDQCYKVESITFGEDGLIELAASYAKITSDGKLEMLQNWGGEYVITGGNPLFVVED